MTNEQKMRAVVEAAEECWHWSANNNYGEIVCDTCKRQMTEPFNPSPTDLNELFRLAEKLGVYTGHWKHDSEMGEYHVQIEALNDKSRARIYAADTLAEAMLNALLKAVS